VAGSLLSDDELLLLLEECEAANEGAPITFFEVTTAAAFLAFARRPADAVILETGLGGRLDATNVIDKPAATVITPISLDHQSFLGETIADIAGEKAGIIKERVPCVVAGQPDAAMRVIERRARQLGAPLLREGIEWHVSLEEHGFAYEGQGVGLGLPFPALPGAHQIQNAGAAIAALLASGLSAADAPSIAQGLAAAEWPARLQNLNGHPYGRLLPPGWELWLDGGHNEGAAQVIARHLAGWSDRPAHLVMGMLNTKDPASFLKPILPHVASVTAVPIPGEPNARTPEDIVRNAGAEVFEAPDVTAALRRVALADRPARVLICGSLYLAGQILAAGEDPGGN
jgi:dihydrofolate synthase/folylpolyglutamate synthase